MPEGEIVNAIKELSNVLGMASSEIIPHYVRWYIWASLGYMILGLCICIGSIWWFQTAGRNINRSLAIFILAIVLVIGGLIFVSQVGDLLAPQGIAIHRFIKDMRG